MGHALTNVAKFAGNIVNKIPGGKYLVDAALIATGNPEFIPLVEGTSTTAKTGSLGKGLLSGIGSYAGAQLGGSVLGNLGTAGNAIGAGAATGGATAASTIGSGLGNIFGNSVGDAVGAGLGRLAATPVSNMLGGAIGSSLGASFGGSGNTDKGTTPTLGASPFNPSQQSAMALPGSLSSFSGLDSGQQLSNIANQGVYGGGLGPDEQQYFTNMINRQLVDQSGKTKDISLLNPIENSYLSQLGLGGYGNSKDLLQAISKWQPQA